MQRLLLAILSLFASLSRGWSFIHVVKSKARISIDEQALSSSSTQQIAQESQASLSNTPPLTKSKKKHSSWYDRADELRNYKDRFGDCLVPRRFEENPSLGNWVNKQRQLYRKFQKGEATSITQERIDILNDLDFVWDASHIKASRNSQKERTWWKHFDELRQHMSSDHNNNLGDSLASNSSLGFWVLSQRNEYEKYYNGHSSTLTEERVAALNSIQFDWKSRREQSWDQHIRALQDYKDKHGDCIVPISYKENPKLAHWVSNQRKQHNLRAAGKPSLLTKERVTQLEKMGFVWNRWEYEFQQKEVQCENNTFK